MLFVYNTYMFIVAIESVHIETVATLKKKSNHITRLDTVLHFVCVKIELKCCIDLYRLCAAVLLIQAMYIYNIRLSLK